MTDAEAVPFQGGPRDDACSANRDMSLERVLALTSWLAVFAMLSCEALAIPRRYFVNDDYQMLYTGWLRSVGKVAPRDFGVQSFHVLPELFAALFRLFGRTIDVALFARVPFLFAMASVVALTGRLARRLLPSMGVPFATLFCIANWPMLERGLDLRPDLLSAVLWLSALLLATAPKRTRRSLGGLGAVLAFALILRAKSVLLLPVIATLILLDHAPSLTLRERLGATLADAAWILAGALPIALLFAAYLTVSEQWQYFFEGHRALAHVAQAGEVGLRGRSLESLMRLDPFLVGCAALGLVSFFHLVKDRRARLLGEIIALMTLSIAANNAFYMYNFVALAPLIAPLAAAGCLLLLALPLGRSGRRALALALLVSIPVWHGTLLIGLASQSTNAGQLALHRALAQTAKNTTVFAFEGLGLFRPSLHDFRLSAVSRGLYDSDEVDLSRQLRGELPEVMVLSYRLPAWLHVRDQVWAKQHYAELAPLVLVRSEYVNAGTRASVTIPRESSYHLGDAGCRVDGSWREAREILLLARGTHDLVAADRPCILSFDWPEARSLERPPFGYLISPDWSLYQAP